MDPSLLRTFVEVARCGSITVAARGLGYTQSAVSRQIAALESAVEARLFDRRPRGVDLTAHGRCLLPHAEAVLRRLDAAAEDLEALDRLDHGVLRLGAFATAIAALVPAVMSAFAAKHPAVSLSLVEGTTRTHLHALQAGDIDLAVVSAFAGQSLDRDEFELVQLLDDRLLVASAAGHWLAERDSVRLAELAAERWIAGQTDPEGRTLNPLRLAPDAELRIDFSVGEWTAKLGLAAAGIGLTLVPSLAAHAVRPDVALTPLDPRDDAIRRVYAATARQRTAAPAARAISELLVEHARRFDAVAA